MKTTERFDRAIKALVQAFFDGGLVKKSCAACACGNIIAASYGKRVIVNREDASLTKSPVTDDYLTDWYFAIKPSIIYREGLGTFGKTLISNTGYSIEEFRLIEEAFENNTHILGAFYKKVPKEEIIQDQFNGLIAVVDVLCEIEGYDATPYKKMFEYTDDFKPVNELCL